MSEVTTPLHFPSRHQIIKQLKLKKKETVAACELITGGTRETLHISLKLLLMFHNHSSGSCWLSGKSPLVVWKVWKLVMAVPTSPPPPTSHLPPFLISTRLLEKKAWQHYQRCVWTANALQDAIRPYRAVKRVSGTNRRCPSARQNPEDSDWDKAAIPNKKNGGITFTRHAEWQREPAILNQADVLHRVEECGEEKCRWQNTHKAMMAFHLSPPRVW